MVSFVIPAFDEEENLGPILNEIRGVMSNAGLKWEAIVVDDHSNDRSYEVVEKLAWPEVRAIRLSRRSGSHVALRAGLLATTGDCAICVSADGQDNPSIFLEMIKKWRDGYHVVWALRESRESEPFLEKIFAQTFYRILKLMTSEDAKKIDLNRADFYLLDRTVVDSLNSCKELNTSLFGLIAWIGFRQSSVTYVRRERRRGKSKWNFKSRLKLAADWIVAFSGVPLKLVLILGLLIAGFGFLFSIYLCVDYFRGQVLPGWSSIMVAILVLSGAQLCTLGVLGEYLLRNLNEARKRPMFFVEKQSR